ncbi:unnamed protein product [Thelazia callipaeda]|uniref:diacylglycerol O-acyltransferase n=1 Tax=Thelazia callipaeda TaxID=103827 RepID=A0A158RD13_THECL|nr:unnamed protein product [Thelazia callipaeda]
MKICIDGMARRRWEKQAEKKGEMNKSDFHLRKRLSSSQSDSIVASSSRHSSFSSRWISVFYLVICRSGFDFEKPVHIAQVSLFSGSSGWKDYRGIFNLAVLLLFVSNGRVALENIMKYGVLVSPIGWIYFISRDPWWKWPNMAMLLMSNITIFIVYLMEKLLARKWLSNKSAFIIYFLIFTLHISLPAAITWILQVALNCGSGHPLYSVLALSVYVVLFLKLTSYAHSNYWYRYLNTQNENGKVKCLLIFRRDKYYFILKGGEDIRRYPHNLTLPDLYYFIFAPTLCYELHFPRSNRCRKSFIMKRMAELICLTLIIVALCQQWVAPLLRNSVEPFTTMNFGLCIERVLKLAIPNHVIWLISFYTIFHSFLNLVAELMKFADRQFYLDFWNAETLAVFWKTWNIPVHRWALRHIYRPMLSNGFSKMNAACAVFFVSAFFHEYLVSIPLHMFRYWAYLCMMAQIPLSLFTEKVLKGGRPGNIVMWLSIILGQPLAILMYVHDWYVTHYPRPSQHFQAIDNSTTTQFIMPEDGFLCSVISDAGKRWFIHFDRSRSAVVVTDAMVSFGISTYEKTMTIKDRMEFAGNVSESLLEHSWR